MKRMLLAGVVAVAAALPLAQSAQAEPAAVATNVICFTVPFTGWLR